MQELDAIRVPMTDCARERWREKYGVKEIYLSDIAAGALVEVPRGWGKEEAPTRVSNGLRHLLQELWRLDLARPVVAVCWPGPEANDDATQALERLTWDQEQHRGDFALRRASDETSAKELLCALLGDSMGALDDAALEDRVGSAEVRDTFQVALAEAQKSKAEPRAEPSVRLIETLLAELDRAKRADSGPDLVGQLRRWLRSEEVSP